LQSQDRLRRYAVSAFELGALDYLVKPVVNIECVLLLDPFVQGHTLNDKPWHQHCHPNIHSVPTAIRQVPFDCHLHVIREYEIATAGLSGPDILHGLIRCLRPVLPFSPASSSSASA